MRRLAFAAVVVALGAALLLVGLRSSHPTQAGTSTVAGEDPLAAAPGPPPPAGGLPPPGARHQARHFVVAFLSYEVGVTGAQTESAIRKGASHAFAVELLAHPPTPPGSRAPAPARITRLRVDPVPGHPDLALVSGEARRPAGPEPFAFAFADRGGRWLAVAPGE